MNLKDVHNLAQERKIPAHIIDRFISEIEVDENGEVKDELAVMWAVNEIAHNVDHIRGNLEEVKRLKQKNKLKARQNSQ